MKQRQHDENEVMVMDFSSKLRDDEVLHNESIRQNSSSHPNLMKVAPIHKEMFNSIASIENSIRHNLDDDPSASVEKIYEVASNQKISESQQPENLET